ncbi:neuronal acetylcholine receptor subunit alpha-7-like protein [Leptotrombidium deliense]|uniref:Neuronal acetylcholine receptor subunit alpha-7-like protein n=1 Tax=Leptotrombidium deliense TaxID=299467 RepID=A0A443SMT2_9ACAR|nr:neuronal acetylcholine receptor subunit alpha-7-like protein [Leptotrombidium deliense]
MFTENIKKQRKQQSKWFDEHADFAINIFILIEHNSRHKSQTKSILVVNKQIKQHYSTYILEWIDSNLRWNASEYGGISEVKIAAHKVWKPDILLYNSADERIDSTFAVNVNVKNNGSCTWLPPGIFKSTCKIDITWFPFDDQTCLMKFGSWSYVASALDLRVHSEEGGDLSTYIENGEWILLGLSS